MTLQDPYLIPSHFSDSAPSKFKQMDIPPSILYTILPSILQARLPTLASFRHSVADFRAGRNHVRDQSDSQTHPETPPPLYTSRRESICSALSSELDVCGTCTTDSEYGASSHSTLRPFTVLEAKTGINWEYANKGLKLLTQAHEESVILARMENHGSPTLTRELHLHGIYQLLRGLPNDLTSEEILSIRSAMPAVVQDQSIGDIYSLTRASRECNESVNGLASRPSLLHRIVAMFVFQLFILLNFLLPYVRLLIGHACQLERDHKVVRRLFSKSVEAIDTIGRKGVRLSQTVYQMNDGKVGQAINDLTFWWVQGLAGGIQQGIIEGVGILGPEHNERPGGNESIAKIK